MRKFAKQDPNREAYHGSSSSSEEHEHEHFKEGRWARPKANFRFSSDESSKSVEAESSTSSEPVKQDGDRPEPLKVIHERIHQKYVKAHANDEQP